MVKKWPLGYLLAKMQAFAGGIMFNKRTPEFEEAERTGSTNPECSEISILNIAGFLFLSNGITEDSQHILCIFSRFGRSLENAVAKNDRSGAGAVVA